MDLLQWGVLPWILTVVQVLGLASAWWARHTEGSPRQTLSQSLFLTCLALVGAATMLSLTLKLAWYLSGTTLALMVVAVTGEFRPRHRELA